MESSPAVGETWTMSSASGEELGAGNLSLEARMNSFTP